MAGLSGRKMCCLVVIPARPRRSHGWPHSGLNFSHKRTDRCVRHGMAACSLVPCAVERGADPPDFCHPVPGDFLLLSLLAHPTLNMRKALFSGTELFLSAHVGVCVLLLATGYRPRAAVGRSLRTLCRPLSGHPMFPVPGD